MVVDPPGEVPLAVVEVDGEQAATACVAEAAARPFDLAAGPLLHGLLVRETGGGQHRLLLSLHHAVTDGWSTEVLLDDLLALYGAASGFRTQTGTSVALTVPWPVLTAAVSTCLVLAVVAAMLPARAHLAAAHPLRERA